MNNLQFYKVCKFQLKLKSNRVVQVKKFYQQYKCRTAPRMALLVRVRDETLKKGYYQCFVEISRNCPGGTFGDGNIFITAYSTEYK